jgi:hypothetical protein
METEKKECKSCKNAKSMIKSYKGTLLFSLYFLFAAIYGTVKIVEKIISLF